MIRVCCPLRIESSISRTDESLISSPANCNEFGKAGGPLPMSKSRIALTAVLALIAIGGVLVAITAMDPVKPAMWASSTDAPQEKRWQAVAPGRVEACSGQIKVAAATIGVVH